jgi:hypothetical protein
LFLQGRVVTKVLPSVDRNIGDAGFDVIKLDLRRVSVIKSPRSGFVDYQPTDRPAAPPLPQPAALASPREKHVHVSEVVDGLIGYRRLGQADRPGNWSELN